MSLIEQSQALCLKEPANDQQVGTLIQKLKDNYIAMDILIIDYAKAEDTSPMVNLIENVLNEALEKFITSQHLKDLPVKHEDIKKEKWD